MGHGLDSSGRLPSGRTGVGSYGDVAQRDARPRPLCIALVSTYELGRVLRADAHGNADGD
jgi:hypothetical protein